MSILKSKQFRIISSIFILVCIAGGFIFYTIRKWKAEGLVQAMAREHVMQGDRFLGDGKYPDALVSYQNAEKLLSELKQNPSYLKVKIQVATYMRDIKDTLCHGDYNEGRRIMAVAMSHPWPEGIPPVLKYQIPIFEDFAKRLEHHQTMVSQILKYFNEKNFQQGGDLLKEVINVEKDLEKKGAQSNLFGVGASLLQDVKKGEASSLTAVWKFQSLLEITPESIRNALSIDSNLQPSLSLLRKLLYKGGSEIASILSKLFSSIELETLAQSYLTEKGEGDPIQRFDIALKLAPRLGDVYLYRGRAYRDENKIDQAISDYTEALRFSLSRILTERGELYLLQKKYDLALKDFNEALEKDPENPNAKKGMQELKSIKEQDEKK